MPQFFNPSPNIGLALANALSGGIDAFQKARRQKVEEDKYEEEKQYREGILAAKLDAQGLVRDKNTKEITKSPDYVQKMKMKTLAERIKAFAAMPEDWKMGTFEGKKEREEIQGLLNSGAGIPDASMEDSSGLMGGTTEEDVPVDEVPREPQGLLDVNQPNRQPAGGESVYGFLPGYKSKRERALEDYGTKANIAQEAKISGEKKKMKDVGLMYQGKPETEKKAVGTLVDALKNVHDYEQAWSGGGRESYVNPDTPIIGGLISDTPITIARRRISNAAGRLESGAAMNAEEIKMYKSLMPRPADSPDQQALKLKKMRSFLETKLTSYGLKPEQLGEIGFKQEDTASALKEDTIPIRVRKGTREFLIKQEDLDEALKDGAVVIK